MTSCNGYLTLLRELYSPSCNSATPRLSAMAACKGMHLVQTLHTGVQGTSQHCTMLSEEMCTPVSTVPNLSALRSAARGDLVVSRTRYNSATGHFLWLVRSSGTVYHWTSFSTDIINVQKKHAQDTSVLSFLLH